MDRFSRIYTPAVVAAAAGLAIVPPVLGASFGEWFYRALALLIVACPCALVISTPVTVVSGIGAASRRGILLKGGAVLEAAGKLRALAFDKTGTLTEGRPILARVAALDGRDRAGVLRLAAALERRSEHPLAYAILSATEGEKLPEVESFRSVPGRGAKGVVEGRRYVIGSPRFLSGEGISTENARDALQTVERAGETPVVLGDETKALAVFGLADAPRPDAMAALGELREAGVEELVMLSGDAEGPARRIAERPGHLLPGAATSRTKSRGGAGSHRGARLGRYGGRRGKRRPRAGSLLGRLRHGGRRHRRSIGDCGRGTYARRSATVGEVGEALTDGGGDHPPKRGRLDPGKRPVRVARPIWPRDPMARGSRRHGNLHRRHLKWPAALSTGKIDCCRLLLVSFRQPGPGALQCPVMLRSVHVLVSVAVLVALFGMLHPALDAAGLCGSGGCPEMMESSGGHTGFSLSCIAAVVSAFSVVAFAGALFSLGRRPTNHSRPHELYLTLDPPPPRLSPRV